MLTRLNGILLGGQTIGIISHGIEHIITAQTLVAGIDIAGYITQRMAYMKSCSRWIGKHVEHVELVAISVFTHLIGLVGNPFRLPLLFYFSEIIFHRCFICCFVISNLDVYILGCKGTANDRNNKIIGVISD